MKKYILGIAAIALVLAASAFTHFSKAKPVKEDGLVWFAISGDILPGEEVPALNAIYLGHDAEPPAHSTDNCDGSIYQCVSGFNPDQVNGTVLKDDSQIPADDSHRRK